jgi:hypothetical protein
MIRDVAEEVEYLPGRYKALSSNSSAAENKNASNLPGKVGNKKGMY